MQHMLFLVKHLQIRAGGPETDQPCPQTNVFNPKLPFLGHFLANNSHFLGEAGPKQPFPGLYTLQHTVFSVNIL